jgi:hypothetical protein
MMRRGNFKPVKPFLSLIMAPWIKFSPLTYIVFNFWYVMLNFLVRTWEQQLIMDSAFGHEKFYTYTAKLFATSCFTCAITHESKFKVLNFFHRLKFISSWIFNNAFYHRALMLLNMPGM